MTHFPKIPTSKTVHGVTLTDDYGWLRAQNWQEVLVQPRKLDKAILNALKIENKKADAFFKQQLSLSDALKTEMRARIKEQDESVPVSHGAYLYFSRFLEGAEQPQFWRSHASQEQLLLDGVVEAGAKNFFEIGALTPSPSHALLAWSYDDQGNENFKIRVRDVASSQDLKDLITHAQGDVVWGADGSYFYYLKLDEEHRANRLYLHKLGSKQAQDTLIYEEKDHRYYVNISRSRGREIAFIHINESDKSEVFTLDLTRIDTEPRLILSRRLGHEFSVDYHPSFRGKPCFFVESNKTGENYALLTLDVESLTWGDELIPARETILLSDFALFQNWLVRLEVENALPRIVVRSLLNDNEFALDFSEEAFSIDIDDGEIFDCSTFRFSFSSPRFPDEIYEFDMSSRERTLLKQQEIPSGHNPQDYVVKRLSLPSHDGVLVPVTLLYKCDVSESAPLFLESYGAYGIAYPADFDAERLSLVNRGFVYAIAHVRGGMDCGYHWYRSGKLEHKENTFHDTIAVARGLCESGVTTKGSIVFHGGSAGGMVAGVIANRAPELFAGIIARVPFVDVLNTMLDKDLPLTPPEWSEWGNPIEDIAAFHRLYGYSPYENISAQNYPHMLVLAGLSDPRVTYWEPAKYVARLQELRLNDQLLLLHTNLSAGHSGSSGRFERLDEMARLYAFALFIAYSL